MSALLCIATALIWVKSYYAADCLTVTIDGCWRQIVVSRGVGAIKWQPHSSLDPDAPLMSVRYWQFDPGNLYVNVHREWRFAGFGLSNHGATQYFLTPMPAVLLAFSALPVWRFRHARTKSFRPGHCSSCGYDLRASVNRCPECGAEFGLQTV
jgi:hypothetical protein